MIIKIWNSQLINYKNRVNAEIT